MTIFVTFVNVFHISILHFLHLISRPLGLLEPLLGQPVRQASKVEGGRPKASTLNFYGIGGERTGLMDILRIIAKSRASRKGKMGASERKMDCNCTFCLTCNPQSHMTQSGYMQSGLAESTLMYHLRIHMDVNYYAVSCQLSAL